MLAHLLQRNDSLPQVAVGGPVDGSHSSSAGKAKNHVPAV
jgi:hypothetical protein